MAEQSPYGLLVTRINIQNAGAIAAWGSVTLASTNAAITISKPHTV